MTCNVLETLSDSCSTQFVVCGSTVLLNVDSGLSGVRVCCVLSVFKVYPYVLVTFQGYWLISIGFVDFGHLLRAVIFSLFHRMRPFQISSQFSRLWNCWNTNKNANENDAEIQELIKLVYLFLFIMIIFAEKHWCIN